MSYTFEYIDIILLAMIAGFIFLRLRGILGKKTGFEENINSSFPHEVPETKSSPVLNAETFDDAAKKDFLNGAKIAYESIITSFSKGDLKTIKNLLDKNVYDQFDEAIKDKKERNVTSETTFIGINSAEIKEHTQNKNMLEVTVEFVSEIISCIKDKDNKVVSGDAQKVKKVLDTWKFTKDSNSKNPNWLIVDTQAQLNKKISDKDKQDWQKFLDSTDKLENKDQKISSTPKRYIERSIDLHGYTLEEANHKMTSYIEECFMNGVNKINVITGKGLRSKNLNDPYQSSNLSILKHSVPNYIKGSDHLMNKIISIDFEAVENPSIGNFDIFLRKRK